MNNFPEIYRLVSAWVADNLPFQIKNKIVELVLLSIFYFNLQVGWCNTSKRTARWPSRKPTCTAWALSSCPPSTRSLIIHTSSAWCILALELGLPAVPWFIERFVWGNYLVTLQKESCIYIFCVLLNINCCNCHDRRSSF